MLEVRFYVNERIGSPEVVMCWESGRLTHRHYKMILDQVFFMVFTEGIDADFITLEIRVNGNIANIITMKGVQDGLRMDAYFYKGSEMIRCMNIGC